MIRLAGLFWLVLVSTAGFAMFAVKYEVQSLEDDLNRVRKEAATEEHAIRMDEVEWAYLTRPEILEEMNRRHLSLTPITTAQLRATLPDIPLRPPPPPPIEDTVVAAAPPAIEPDAAPPPETAQPTAPAMSAQAHASPPTAAPLQGTALASATTPAPAQSSARAPEVIRSVAAKAVTKPTATRRPKSLDDLIAQIVASR